MTGYLDASVSGIIVKDGELRTSGKGTKFLGVTIRIGDGDGAQFCRVTCFAATAEEIAPIAKKGARLLAEGNLTADIYERDGKPTPSLAIAARWARVPAVGKNRPKRESSGQGRQGSNGAPRGSGDRYQGYSSSYDSRSGGSSRHPAFDDDIPL